MMESTAVNMKEEDTSLVVTSKTITTTNAANSIAMTDEIVSPIKTYNEIIVITNDIKHVPVVSELVAGSNETATTVNASSNNSTVEEDQLNIAMASTTISTNEVDEIKQNQGETVLVEQQKPVTVTDEKKIISDENLDLKSDISIKTKSESDDINNSTIGSGFEDAVEYINDEKDSVVTEEQPQDVIEQEDALNDESRSPQEVEGGDGEESKDVSNNFTLFYIIL